jgi:uncharacterized membrane protein
VADLTYARALGIGAVAGLRSMTAPAATLLGGEHPYAGLALLAAGGELIVDKLPMIPARTMPPGLVFRMIAGGLSGGAIAARRERSRTVGIVAGVAGAVAATYLGYELRRTLTKKLGLPDILVALVEDGVAVWGARAANC